MTDNEKAERAAALDTWFYNEADGLLLSGDAFAVWRNARDLLRDPGSRDDDISGALSALRTELKIDLGVRHPDERDVPMAASIERRTF